LFGLLTPSRRRGVEILDDPLVDATVRRTAIADVARSNRWLGGTRAVLATLEPLWSRLRGKGRRLTVADVGAGHCDIAAAVVRAGERRGVPVQAIAVDAAESLVATARERCALGVCGDALRLPFRDESIDLVLCSQLLHHFQGDELKRIVLELHRTARTVVLISDIERSWIAAAGFWAVSFPLGFHPVTRHDGVVSVMRGFTRGELASLVTRATGMQPVTRRHLGWRITATWFRP
jgi:2-polyprenyl-3-methyl-5-hydroxy-6-metoxy-1,4-benzoquinol methylase